MNREFLYNLRDKIISGYEATRDDIEKIKNLEIEDLAKVSSDIRDKFFSDKFDLCTIINGKSGRCSEDCKFCAQSAHYKTGVEEYPFLDGEDIVKDAIRNYENGVNRFSIVTSGRNMKGEELEKMCSVYRDISKKCDIKLCSSNGLLGYDELLKLRESGVRRYHNNIETSRRNFPNICTTHTFDDKINTLKQAKKAGLEICTGGIFGLGEDLDDRIDMAFTVRELNADSMPINILNPIKNTPFEGNATLSYEEIIRSISLCKIIAPKVSIRLAGGRSLLFDNGRWAIESGVDSMISGDMLTTQGITTKKDIDMVRDMGYKTTREE